MEKYDTLPRINRDALKKAKKYLWVFLPLFVTDDMLYNHQKVMPKLNSSQQTFLTFYLIETDAMRVSNNCHIGGFLQLIHNGYGRYVFEKPLSKIIETWGAKKISRIVEEARSPYEKYKDRVRKIKSLKKCSDLYLEIKDFEKLDNEYFKVSLKEAEKIKKYIEKNITEFAIIDESDSQVADVEHGIKEIEDRGRMIEESELISKYFYENINNFTIDNEDNIILVSASSIFGENYTVPLINSTCFKINGKNVTIKVT